MLELLDRLANWWAKTRYEKATRHYEEQNGYSLPLVKEIRLTSEEVEVILEVDNLRYLVNELSAIMTESKAQNYYQLVFFPYIDGVLRPIEVTLRWHPGGKTPAQKAADLELDNKRYLERIEELTDQCNKFYGTLKRIKTTIEDTIVRGHYTAPQTVRLVSMLDMLQDIPVDPVKEP